MPAQSFIVKRDYLYRTDLPHLTVSVYIYLFDHSDKDGKNSLLFKLRTF